MKTKSVKKKLMTTAENLWKEVCRLRDGECQGPKIEEDHVCDGYLQVDHCFSRMTRELFLDPRNGTLICQALHCRKTNKVKGAEKRVDEFVKRREGDEWWKKAMAVYKSKTPYVWNVVELEQLIIKLKEQRAEILGNR